MKQFPLSPYHQFSNSSLNSDFYDRYLSHDGHQPLQTPLIGIDRTQDLLSLKLPPHGPDDQDSVQRFPKEWAFTAEDTKHNAADNGDNAREADRSDTPTSTRRSQEKLSPGPAATARGDKNNKKKRGQTTSGAGSKSDNTALSSAGSSLISSKLALLNQQVATRDGGQMEVSTGFFFRYNRSSESPSKSSHQRSTNNGDANATATARRTRQQAASSDDEDGDSGDNDDHDDHDSKAQDMFVESMKHFNPSKRSGRQSSAANAVVASDVSDDVVCYDLRSKNCSPDHDHHLHRHQQRQSSGGGGDSEHSDTDNATSLSQQYHGQESCFGLDPSKQRFQYVLAAPISVATKLNEDTMTYLNQGQAYEIKLGNTTDVAEARKGFMCSIINIGFYERHMQQAENELWQQWSQQHPNEKIFSVDMKLSYNVYGVDSDGLNKYEFLWDSSKAAGVFIRINSISTEFTPKKHGGEKGVPFRLSIETFSYNSKTHDSYFISAASCQIKVFKPKGAERKIRSDRDKIYKRPANEQEKYHRSCDHTTFQECSLTSLHPLADSSLCYYRHSHGHFASKQVSGTSTGAGNSNAGAAGGAPSSGHTHQGSSGHNSEDELEQHAQPAQADTTNGNLDQNNRSSATTNHSAHENRDADSSPIGSRGQQLKLKLAGGSDSPYGSHRLSVAMHPLSYRNEAGTTTQLDHHHLSIHQQQQQANSGGGGGADSFNSANNGPPHTHQINNNSSSNNELHHHNHNQTTGQPYGPASQHRVGLAAAGAINNASQHFHGMTAAAAAAHHYYGHPLPAALVPAAHHMTPGPSYALPAHSAGGPIAHPVTSGGFPPLPNHHLQDVKTSIYHRHHQLVTTASDKQTAFGQHAAAAAASVAITASYGAAAAFKSHHHHHATSAANLGQLAVANTNYQSYFAASSSTSSTSTATAVAAAAAAATESSNGDCPGPNESLHHDQQTKEHGHHNYQHHHHNQQQQNINNCYNNDTYSSNNNNSSNQLPQLHSLRQRSASTSVASTNNHCQTNAYARHHFDNYFTSSANAPVGSHENLSSPSQNNSNNQWSTHNQNTGSHAPPINHHYNNGTHHQYSDCCPPSNVQASESPSSCCSRYKNVGSIEQSGDGGGGGYMTSQSVTTNESVSDNLHLKQSPHITINSNCVEVISWFASNRFGSLAKTFNNFSGADLLRLSKTELIEICGLIEGIRLYNSLHNQPIKPRRVLYICLETDDIYHPVYLYDLTLDELLGEISLTLDSNSSSANSHQDDDQHQHHHHPRTGKTSSNSGSSSTDSRSSSRPLSAEMNDDELYQSEQYSFEGMHGSCSDQDNNNNNNKPTSDNPMQEQHQISRLLVDGVAAVKVVATEKVVQMLEDESVWTLSVQTSLSGSIEACITACRSHKRHCK